LKDEKMLRVNRLLAALLVLVVVVFSVAPLAAQDDVATYNGAWPYEVPPTGHFNTFSNHAMTFGYYQDLMEPPIAVLIWSEGTYEGMAADSFGYDDDGNYVVTLKDGYTWSDGSPISGDDLMTTFQLFRLRGDAVWSSVTDLEKVDDMTVKFLMDAPSSVAERQILTANLRPNSVYGDLATRAQALVDDGKTKDDTEWADLLTELTEFRPESLVSGGPFVLDTDSISDANVTLNLNEGGIGADVSKFQRAVLWNGETEVVTPLVANGNTWFITHGLPPTTEQAFVDQGIDILRTGMFQGPAIYFNHTVYPLSVKEVRQAVAMVIDRQQNGVVSLGQSGVPVELMTGFSDSLADLWLSEETIDSLNTYEYDVDAAAALLEGVGFSKGSDGIWVDDQGNKLSFELTFPQEFADWSAAAENATEQLNDFGFDITARGVQFQQAEQDALAGNYQLTIRNWGIGDPLPGLSYLQPYDRWNGQGELAGQAGGGMGFDTNVTYSGGEINVRDLAIHSGQGTDAEAQRADIEQLAVSFNELLPIVPLWERYTNNAMNREFLDAPPFDDPIYLNDSTADFWMTYLLMTGGIGPAAQS
jgi:peptide/nickel transport system substrate-binding protein